MRMSCLYNKSYYAISIFKGFLCICSCIYYTNSLFRSSLNLYFESKAFNSKQNTKNCTKEDNLFVENGLINKLVMKNREVCVKLLSLSFATLITEVNYVYFIYIFKKLLKSHREIYEAKEFARKCKYSKTYLRSWNWICCFNIEF